MNDHSVLDNEQLTNDAIFNTLMYLQDHYDFSQRKDDEEYTVDEFITDIEGDIVKEKISDVLNGMSEEQLKEEYKESARHLAIVKNAMKNNDQLGSYVVGNQSQIMTDSNGKPLYEKYGLSACTFTAPNGDITVAFRGTNGGEWPDNGTALGGEVPYSDQQMEAKEYFDMIVEQNGWNEAKPNIHLTGHSKGGNKTQFVVMMAEHADLITSGYSLDGQGMSPETLEWMEEELKEKYEERRGKLYSISADNDYVNVLGERLVPKDRLFFLKSELSGAGWHNIECILKEDGTLTDPAEQGEYSKIVQGISEKLMLLPPEKRSIALEGAMGIFHYIRGRGEPVKGQKISILEMVAAVPMLLEKVPFDRVLETVLDDLYDYAKNKADSFEEFVLVGLCIGICTALDVASTIIEKAAEAIDFVAGKIIEFGTDVIEQATEIAEFICHIVKNLWNRNKNTAYGYQYATDNPQIRLDTGKLRGYARELELIHNKIKAVDERMNSLYWRAGSLSELKCLISADLRTGYNAKLTRCINYLDVTAEAFEKTEQKLSNNV